MKISVLMNGLFIEQRRHAEVEVLKEITKKRANVLLDIITNADPK